MALARLGFSTPAFAASGIPCVGDATQGTSVTLAIPWVAALSRKLRTANGAEFLKRFDRASEEELITHYFSHPYCPQENAFVERKIQTEGYEPWAFKEGYTVESSTVSRMSGTMRTIT